MNTTYTSAALRRQMGYLKQQHDPLVTLALTLKGERRMVEIGNAVADYHKATNYDGYADPDQVWQADIDFIVEHRLALICKTQRLHEVRNDRTGN